VSLAGLARCDSKIGMFMGVHGPGECSKWLKNGDSSESFSFEKRESGSIDASHLSFIQQRWMIIWQING